MLNAENTYFGAISPRYSIHRYREDLFKVVKFNGDRSSIKVHLDEYEHYEYKLDPAFSRARAMVLQYALCNEWQWFFTGTIDKAKFDRTDLDAYYKSLSQWIRDERKRTNSQISFLLIPEQHKKTKGTWHIHGMIGNLPDSETERFTKNTCIPGRRRVPRKLIEGGYFNWPRYMEKFGFCSLGKIRDPIATAYYVSKYVSKDMSDRREDLGKHLYYHSRPLNKASKECDIYSSNIVLNQLIEDHEHILFKRSGCTSYDYYRYKYSHMKFCQSTMVNAPWWFPYNFNDADYNAIEMEPLHPMEPPEDFDPFEIDPFYEQTEIRL